MQHPAYFLPRPPLALSPTTRAAFAELYAEAVQLGHGQAVAYTLAAPKWQFLSWLCDTQEVLLHGSGNPRIQEFEPRKSDDLNEFGDRQAVYAASDGIWPIFFAIVDRDRFVRSLNNACARVLGPAGTRSDPYYFFSIDDDALPHQPWRGGTIYILPRAGFTQQPSAAYRGMAVAIAQWVSPTPVRPLARLAVGPAPSSRRYAATTWPWSASAPRVICRASRGWTKTPESRHRYGLHDLQPYCHTPVERRAAGQRGIAAVEQQLARFFAGLARRAAATPFRCRRTVQALAAVHCPTPDDLPEPATPVVRTCASV